MSDWTKDDLRRGYDEAASRYDRSEAPLEWLGISRMRRNVFGRASGRVLEVAVGTGVNLPHFPAACDVTAVDLSPRMLAVARGRAERLGRRASFDVMDAEMLELDSDSFDTVASSMSVCTFPDPVRALSEMARVCRPGGRVLLLEHGRSSWEVAGRWQDRHAHRFSSQLGCHWNRDPVALAQRAGLRVVRSRRRFLGVFQAIEAVPEAG